MRENRDLLAAQARRPAARARREANVFRPEPLAAAAEKRPELLLVHTASMRAALRRILVLTVPESCPEVGRSYPV